MKFTLLKLCVLSILLQTSMVSHAESLQEYQLRQFYKKNKIETKAKKAKDLKTYSSKPSAQITTSISDDEKKEKTTTKIDFDTEQHQERLIALKNKRSGMYKNLLRVQDNWEKIEVSDYSYSQGVVEDINEGKCHKVIGKPCSRPQAKRIKLLHQETVDDYENLKDKVYSTQKTLRKLDKRIAAIEKNIYK